MKATQARTAKETPHNVLCDYQTCKFVSTMVDAESIRNALMPDHIVTRRTTAISRMDRAGATRNNAYAKSMPDGQSCENIYPEKTPRIFAENAANGGDRHKRKRRRPPCQKTDAGPSSKRVVAATPPTTARITNDCVMTDDAEDRIAFTTAHHA